MAALGVAPDELALTLQLVAEMCLGNRSRHAQYIDLLTTQAIYSSPLLWRTDELRVRTS
jgi:hypothetical protein